MNAPDVVVITGMSGSGRTQALHVFEDMGYYCIDNLPPRLLLDLAGMVGINAGVGRHLAVTCDLRSQGLFDDLADSLASLTDHEMSYRVVFLDASDEVLVRRYNENRRRHPIAYEGEEVAHAVARERALLADVKAHADLVIDTTSLKTRALTAQLRRVFSELTEQQLLEVHVFSFGFKHGLPAEADLMIDVRFLPNPFYEPELRDLNGNDAAVARYVLDNTVGQDFLAAWEKLLDTVMPGYVAEGKSLLSIAVGCTGGQHRSVAIANVTAAHLSELGYRVSISHRDLPKAARG
ncbi:MAG: RNase adapter RapZ [Atopobiaceae bacterium]|nr:RNase adapter RapZ [Atopobiaceae bacterium]